MSYSNIDFPNKSSYQLFNNEPMDFKITCFPQCNIIKIDMGIIHIESTYYSENYNFQQLSMGINMFGKITYKKDLPRKKIMIDEWQ